MRNDSISIAITHFNRYDLLVECLRSVPIHPAIREIVVVDDASTDGSWEKIAALSGRTSNLWCYRNSLNLDCYRNKREAVFRSNAEWVVLLDSDNQLSSTYISRLCEMTWDKDLAYLPTEALPHFDYRRFQNVVVSHANAAQCSADRLFFTALNTANYFFNRQSYLDVWDSTIDPHTADSMFQNYNWLKAGKQLCLLGGLFYYHRVHEGSHYKQNFRKTGNFASVVEQKIQDLR